MAGELCTIRVNFISESDEQVLRVKSQVQAAVKDVSDARVDLSMMSRPTLPRPEQISGLLKKPSE